VLCRAPSTVSHLINPAAALTRDCLLLWCKQLVLDNCRLGDKGVELIAKALPKMNCLLEKLSLRYTIRSDVALAAEFRCVQ